MKKIIMLGIVLTGLFIGSSVSAYVSWNTHPNDCPDINIATPPNNGYGSPCWNGVNVNGNPGSYVDVKIYYHNTGNSIAEDTYIKINAPTGSGTSHSFSGKILSNQSNSNLYTSDVTLNISSSQSLTLSSTTWWTKNGNGTLQQTPLLNGQSASAVISSNGLYIGDIAANSPGWPAQGAVVARFHISNNTSPQNCEIENFYADPSSVDSGGSSTFHWETKDCITGSINQGVGTVSGFPDGNKTINNITSTKTYTLTAYGANNSSDTSLVTINVTALQTTGTINASSSSCIIPSGGSSCPIIFSWNTVNPPPGSVSTVTHNYNTVATGNSGSQTFNISNGQQTYYLYNSAVLLDQETVSGNCTTGTTWNGYVCSPNLSFSCTISDFDINPTSINLNQSVNISWSTNNCTSVSVSGPNFNSTSLNNYGQNIYPQNSGTYTINAFGSNGSYATPQSIYVNVNNNNNNDTCNITEFTANNETYTEIEEGDPVELEWVTEDCVSASISGGVGNVYPVNNGDETVYPNYSRTYTLTAYGNNGYSDSRSVTVEVNEQNNNEECRIREFTVDGDDEVDIEEGDGVEFEWRTEDCDHLSISGGVGSVSPVNNGDETIYPEYSRTYTLTAYGEDGESDTETVRVNVDEDNNNDDEDNCRISYFNASPTSINYGNSSTLSWSTNGCTSVSISNIGLVNSTYSQTVYPSSTTNYILYAYDSDGDSVTRTVQVSVNNYVPPPTPVYNNCAVTTVATNITQNSATLNGIITNSNSYSMNTYFEYGTTVNLGYQTTPRTISGNTSFNQTISNLSRNTIYFYRLVSDCSNSGLSKGSIEIFQTLGTQTTNTTIIRQGTTVIGTESPIMLKIENRYQSFRVGDTVDYTVTYKNISNKKLTKVILQVVLPKGVAYLNSSRGTYISDTYTLTVPIEDLTPGLEGVVYLQGRVDSIDSGSAQIVTTAILVYTSPRGAQENAIAYVLNNPILDDFSLGALALFGWIFKMGILGWMLLLILILLAILLFRKVYRKE